MDIFREQELNKNVRYTNRTEKYSPDICGDIIRSGCSEMVGVDTG